MRRGQEISQSSATRFSLLVDNFVSAGATANNVRFLFRFKMPYVSSLSRSAILASGQVLLLEPEPHRLTLTALRKIGHNRQSCEKIGHTVKK